MTTKTKKTKDLADFIETPAQSPQQPIAVAEQVQPEPVIVESVPEPLPVEQTIPGDPSAAEQMVSKADETIAQLEHQLADVAQQIASAYVEMETFPQGRQERTIQLRDARDVLKQSEDAHIKAVAYAKLAQGTLNEQASIKAVSTAQKEVHLAKEALTQIEREVEEADQIATTREQELSSTLETLRAEQERLQSELYNTRDARMLAFAELGMQRYNVVQGQVVEHQARIDELRSQLLAAQVEYHDYLESALPTVQDWREHRQAIRELAPASEDPTGRVIASSVVFMETLLRERFQLKEQMRLPSFQANWLSLLIVDGDDLTYINDPVVKKERLENRLASLKRLQSEYAEYLARS
jgi:hypothetical protein